MSVEVMAVAEWLSIEVFDGAFAASVWQDSHGDALTEAAVSRGARYWQWHRHRWGVVLEILFDDDETPTTFRNLTGVRAALDAVPDPVNGLLVYRGRGGGAGASVPRRPRPLPMSGAAELQQCVDPVPRLALHPPAATYPLN
ncbi:MAG: hypothetical protein ABJA34_00440 [Pseudonocardiales bacterium]